MEPKREMFLSKIFSTGLEEKTVGTATSRFLFANEDFKE